MISFPQWKHDARLTENEGWRYWGNQIYFPIIFPNSVPIVITSSSDYAYSAYSIFSGANRESNNSVGILTSIPNGSNFNDAKYVEADIIALGY